MKPSDTSLGGSLRRFPETTTGMASLLGGESNSSFLAGVEALSLRYWKPIYAYVRTDWAKSNEDAKDLTQAFFLWVLESESLRSFDPERGTFRGFLKVLLRRFVGHQERALQSLKQGGGKRVVSLDSPGVDFGEMLPDPRAKDPEALFDRVWAAQVVNDAIDRVRERCAASGRTLGFEVYEAYDLAGSADRPTYEELAGRLKIAPRDVKRHLFAVRDEVLREIREALAQTTASPRELENEWRELFSMEDPGRAGA